MPHTENVITHLFTQASHLNVDSSTQQMSGAAALPLAVLVKVFLCLARSSPFPACFDFAWEYLSGSFSLGHV